MNTKKNIHEYLTKTGLTAAALARKAGIPKATLSSWLVGTKPSNIDHLKAVAEVMNISLDKLIFGFYSENTITQSILPISLLAHDEEDEYVGMFEVRLKRVSKHSKPKIKK